MLLKRWEPYAELKRMDHHFDRMWRHQFRPTYAWPRFSDTSGRVDVDVYQEADHLVVRAAMPGVKPEDVEVTVADNALTIRGEAKIENEVKEEKYLHRERRFGSFKRTVALPEGTAAEDASATYENGILTVAIPKTEKADPKALKIDIKVPEGSGS